MILVTGAAGKTGRAVLRALEPGEEPVRAWVYRDAQVPEVEALGAADARVGDMRSRRTWDAALEGVRALYHIGPNVHPDELVMGRTAVDAARAAGVETFVYHSVLHPQIEAMPHHWRKLRVEERLLEAGPGFTVLQPAAYMQNLLAHRSSIREDGVLPVPYAPDTRIALVDLEEVAEVAARVLTEAGHEGATYQLCGPGAPTQEEVARTLGEALGSAVEVQVVPRAEWRARARERGMDAERADTLVRMFAYYEQHGLPGNPRVLRGLLGRPPASLAAFADREMTGAGERP